MTKLDPISSKNGIKLEGRGHSASLVVERSLTIQRNFEGWRDTEKKIK